MSIELDSDMMTSLNVTPHRDNDNEHPGAPDLCTRKFMNTFTILMLHDAMTRWRSGILNAVEIVLMSLIYEMKFVFEFRINSVLNWSNKEVSYLTAGCFYAAATIKHSNLEERRHKFPVN